MTELHAKTILSLFDADFYKYTFIQPESMIYHCAKDLVTKYGKQGLRTLDSIQLSTAISLKNQSSLFITSDKLLCAFFKQEELPIFSAL